MIQIDRLNVQAGAFRLRDLTLAVPAGCYAVLMGRTGCGKTTLLETICGLKPPLSGEIRINGRDITRAKPAARGIGYVPQDLALFPTLTVQRHIEFALDVRRVDRAAIAARVEELARLLGITALLERPIHDLSGGEAQRVALGRALSFRPQVLLLDEPLSALDEATRVEMHRLLRDVQQSTGVTILHVTHSSAEARALAGKLFAFENGALREADPGEITAT